VLAAGGYAQMKCNPASWRKDWRADSFQPCADSFQRILRHRGHKQAEGSQRMCGPGGKRRYLLRELCCEHPHEAVGVLAEEVGSRGADCTLDLTESCVSQKPKCSERVLKR